MNVVPSNFSYDRFLIKDHEKFLGANDIKILALLAASSVVGYYFLLEVSFSETVAKYKKNIDWFTAPLSKVIKRVGLLPPLSQVKSDSLSHHVPASPRFFSKPVLRLSPKFFSRRLLA